MEIQQHFGPCADWHLAEAARASVQHCFIALETVLDLYPEAQRVRVCCVACGIRLLTDPCNAGRTDLRCPFGCRAERRRRQANERSRDH